MIERNPEVFESRFDGDGADDVGRDEELKAEQDTSAEIRPVVAVGLGQYARVQQLPEEILKGVGARRAR